MSGASVPLPCYERTQSIEGDLSGSFYTDLPLETFNLPRSKSLDLTEVTSVNDDSQPNEIEAAPELVCERNELISAVTSAAVDALASKFATSGATTHSKPYHLL